MKKFAMSLAALSLIAPSVAMAGTAADSLSLRNAAISPVRASAPAGKAKAVATPLIILGVLVVVGGGILLLDDDDNDSN
jgi:hypothetical protein